MWNPANANTHYKKMEVAREASVELGLAITKKLVYVNLDAAERQGITLPQELIEQMDQVIR